MFSGTKFFNQPLDTFNTANVVVNMSDTFHTTGRFNQDLDFDTRKVEFLDGMFADALSFNGYISSFRLLSAK